MADKKISQLTGATTPLAGTEELPLVQSSTTKKVTAANLTAGRSVSASEYTASTGNFIPSTAGKGVDFSAVVNAGSTSKLLADYEEGPWTPTLTTSGTNFTSVSYFPDAVNGRYTKIGNLVFIQGSMRTTAITVGSASGDLRIGGLPFTASTVGFSNAVVNIGSASAFVTNQPSTGLVVGGSKTISLAYRATANGATTAMGFAEANTGYNVNILQFSAVYRV